MTDSLYEADKKNPVGKPLKFKSAEELQAKIDEYYKWVSDNSKPMTIERLACFLDVDRRTILNYSNRDEYFPTIKKARSRILASKMERLNGQNGNVAGIIFDLKNNEGMVDKQEIAQTTKSDVNLTFDEGALDAGRKHMEEKLINDSDNKTDTK